MGVAFDQTPLQPVELPDHQGVMHRFEIRSFLCPTGREMVAEEVPRREDGGGYRFAILGDFEADAWALFQRLYQKMRQEMAQHYLERGDHGWRLADRARLVGRIEWDRDPEVDGRVPLVVVDGKALTWEEVGRLLMQYEGWTVRLQVEDGIDIVGGPLLEGDEEEGR